MEEENELPPKNYCAGVLVVSRVAGQIRVLLGNGYDGWSDFGGKNEWADNRSKKATALRELAEETLGAVDPAALVFAREPLTSETLTKKAYYMYVAWYDEEAARGAVASFERARTNPARVGRLEKRELRWFDLTTLDASFGYRMRSVFLDTFVKNRDGIERRVCALQRNDASEIEGGSPICT
jgi:hypothetical protein